MAGLTEKQVIALPEHVRKHIQALATANSKLQIENNTLTRERDAAERQVRELTASVNKLRGMVHEANKKS